MENNFKEIRWKQRFQNFEKAFEQLSKGVYIYEKLDEIGKEGLIQRFEYTLELAWKTLKDYIESEKILAKSPASTIKYAFQMEIIENGELWMKMLDDRNLMAHTYDEENFNYALINIKEKYYEEIKKLYEFFKNEQ
jgi:nucleotidyltransferase substrate binding protein (TIGR01987 family)